MSEICSFRILELIFLFKTYFSILMLSSWPSGTPSRNTIKTRNKLLWSVSKRLQPPRFSRMKKSCWRPREKIFYLHLCWTRPASFPRKFSRFKRNLRNISRSRPNIRWWRSLIVGGRWKKTEGLSSSTDYMSSTKQGRTMSLPKSMKEKYTMFGWKQIKSKGPGCKKTITWRSVSYTHLTLPTILLV